MNIYRSINTDKEVGDCRVRLESYLGFWFGRIWGLCADLGYSVLFWFCGRGTDRDRLEGGLCLCVACRTTASLFPLN